MTEARKQRLALYSKGEIMIRLTNETRINQIGKKVDSSIYLIRYDERNLALIEGKPNKRTSKSEHKYKKIIGYYSDIKTALKKSIGIVIKHQGDIESLEDIIDRIEKLEKAIDNLPDYPSMIRLLKGE